MDPLAELAAAVAADKARRRLEAKTELRRRIKAARPVRVREYTEAEYLEQVAIDEYETSGQAWAARFAAQPDERLHFSERRRVS